ncbi:arabinosyltransferase domain-containing protein [Actinomycetospora sp. OC33-EN08]|uniref:Arabinosyltransferase domain-containing protein n=1 Tax=Actinomycetospora aurantiaca TaxID=3129233 RepID=A0ABU8MT89_9PSEU
MALAEDTDRGVDTTRSDEDGSDSNGTGADSTTAGTRLALLRRLAPVRLVSRAAPRETVELEQRTDAFTPDDERPDRWGPDDWGLDGLLVARVVAVTSALVAVVCGVLLPFAPVVQNVPQISWPLDVQRPESTMLMLTAYQPESLDVRFSCRAARAAGATPDGLVMATMSPTSGDFDDKAMSVRVRGDVVTIRTGARDVVAQPLPPGECSYRVSGDAAGVRVLLDGRELGQLAPRLGTPDPDEVRDVPPDSEPASKPISALPDVDALTTSLGELPGASPEDLSVSITADDRYASTPTSLKQGLTTATVIAVIVGCLAATGAIVLGRRRRRRTAESQLRPTPWWARLDRIVLKRIGTWRPRVVDVVVVLVLFSWLYLTPLSDDDGYYAQMAANVPFSGYVPNYFQLYNQGFTPFSWPYYLLSWWEQRVGMAPVALRVPSLLLALLTWVAVRAFVARCSGLTHPWQEHRWAAFATRVALAAAFLAWWLPYGITTRPEPFTAAFAAVALALVAEGVERERLDVLAVAVGVGGIGLMTAPTGFICLAPLLAAAPTAWRVIRRRSAHWWEIPPRWLVVIAPGALGAVAGFADGTYGDFVRSQAIFAPIQRAQTWYLEFGRYAYLLDETSRFGAYAKRTAVLLCLLGVVWFLVTAVVARVRDLPVPTRLMLVGWTVILAFALLLPTPSKPSHHFGAIAGVGAPFLALMLVAGPRLVRDAVRSRGGAVPMPAIIAAAVAAVGVIALAGHGRNRWAFMWGLGLPSWLDYPSVKGFYFDEPQYWAAILVVLAVVVALVTSWRWRGWRPWSLLVAIPLLCVASMFATTTRFVADFALAADRTASTYSPAADSWQDPSATRCGAEQAIDVLTPQRIPLPPRDPVAPVEDEAPDQAFLRDAYLPTSQPPVDLPRGLPVWGSFLEPSEGRSPDARTGTFTTNWFRLPGGSPSDLAFTTVVSGRVGEGNSLRLEFARQDGPAGPIRELGGVDVDEKSDDTAWRAVNMTESGNPPADTNLIRIVATDTTSDVGGWLAFTAPLAQRWAPMTTALDRSGTYSVNWENSFVFPCIRQPVQQNGVTETMDGFLGYGEERREALSDFQARTNSGGIVGNAYREADVTELPTRFRDFPDTDDNVYLMLFDNPYPSERYTLDRTSRVVSGITP